jgi:hypothetical protein
MKFIVGYTGFVGSNIVKNVQFDGLFNSKNISEAYGKNPSLLVFSGLPAEKFIANNYPDTDKLLVDEAFNNIIKINPQYIVLISTIDVYKNPINVNENTVIDINNLHPYGANRYYLEEKIRQSHIKSTIIRLPGLFGDNLKKNFIYDMINEIPSILDKNTFQKLSLACPQIQNYYSPFQVNFFKRNNQLSYFNLIKLRIYFNYLEFKTINFTDSRSIFQFYNLKYLWNHIEILIKEKIPLINLVTEPILSSDLYEYIFGIKFNNILPKLPLYFNCQTNYAKLFNGENGYIFDKNTVKNEINNFLNNF